LKQAELLDLIEEAYKNAPPTPFPSVRDALKIAGAALKYLTDQCEDKDDDQES
jgi:hypothetical protein